MKCYEEFKKNANGYKDGNAVWGVEVKGSLLFAGRQPCFASMGKNKYKGGSHFYSKVMDGDQGVIKSNPSGLVRFYDWLFNRSPYASAFISKNAEMVVSERVIVADCSVASNLLAGALSAARTPTEFPMLKPYLALVDAGVNEHLAFILSFGVSGRDERCTFNADYSISHKPFDVDCFSRRSLTNFLNNTPVNLNKPHNVNPGYQSNYYIKNLFGEGGDYLRVFLSQYSTKLIDAEQANGVSLNPFKDHLKVKEDTDKYGSFDTVIKCLAVLFERIMGDLHA